MSHPCNNHENAHLISKDLINEEEDTVILPTLICFPDLTELMKHGNIKVEINTKPLTT